MFIRSGGKLAVGLFSTLSFVAGLLGHATLLRTIPGSNARVDQAPRKVELFFNEGIEPIFNSLRVFNRNGLRVDTGEVALSPNAKQMSVALKSNLPVGIYTIDWRATSSDGHQIGGHFGFSLGEEFQASAVSGGGATIQSLPTPAMAITRWLYFVSLMLFAGGFTFGAFILLPAVKKSPVALPLATFTNMRRVFVRFVSWSWLFLLVTAILNLLFKAAAMADSTLLQAADLEVLEGVISLTRYGQMWIGGAGLVLLSGILLWLYGRSQVIAEQPAKNAVILWIEILLSALLLGTVSNSGHASAVNEWKAVAIGADALHLFATAVWVGGLFYLVLIIRSLSNAEANLRARFLGEVVPRFSRTAQLCVGTIVVTGAYTAWLHMPSWSSFITTLYGRALLAKLVLVAPLVIIGAVNLLVIKPQLRNHLIESGEKSLEGALGILNRFRPLVQTEVILGVVILLVVTVLTNVPPAATSTPAGPALIGNETDFEIALRVQPNQIGHNRVEVWVRDKKGNLVSDLDSALLVISMVDMDMGIERIDARVQPDGSYRAEVVLGMAGKWEIDVRVMKKGSSDQRSATFQADISQ